MRDFYSDPPAPRRSRAVATGWGPPDGRAPEELKSSEAIAASQRCGLLPCSDHAAGLEAESTRWIGSGIPPLLCLAPVRGGRLRIAFQHETIYYMKDSHLTQ